MPRRADDTRPRLSLDSDGPSAGRLLAVARTDVEQVRHGAEQGGEFERLVRGAVFAHADAVVGRGVDDLEVLEGAHADGGGGVEVEHEEAGGC